jgi:hypothetical protein
MPIYENIHPRKFDQLTYPLANGWDLRTGLRISGSTEIIIDMARRLEDLQRSTRRILSEMDGPFEHRRMSGDIEYLTQEAELMDWFDELLEQVNAIFGDPAHKQARDHDESVGEDEEDDDERE